MNQEVSQRIPLGLVAAAEAAVPAVGAKPAEHVFRAGAVTSNITPPLDEPIVGNWGQPLAGDVHDELHVRCLVLDDGLTQLAFVIVDNIDMPRGSRSIECPTRWLWVRAPLCCSSRGRHSHRPQISSCACPRDIGPCRRCRRRSGLVSIGNRRPTGWLAA